MKDGADHIGIRKMRSGSWYWVSKAVIRKYASRVGFLPICVYHFLASMVDKGQGCFPSQKYVAERLGCSRASVTRAIKLLEKHGLISVTRRTRYHCVYHLLEVRCNDGEPQVSIRGNSDASRADTNNTKMTIHTNNVVCANRPDGDGGPRRANRTQSREELLVSDIARALGDEGNSALFLSCAQRYPEPFLREALSRVKRMPDRLIRKSRTALFIGLLKHHATGNA